MMAHDRQELIAVRRQRDVAGRAIEQAESELVLQLANQDAQAGWRDEQRIRGAREAAMLRDEQEGAKLARRELHFFLPDY
jgi:hypothetical protein